MNLQKTARHLLGALLLVLLAWQTLLSLGGYSEALFPSPLATLQGLYELIADGVLLKDIGALGVTVTQLTPAEREAFVKATRPVYDKWKTQIGTDLVNMAEKAIAARKQ